MLKGVALPVVFQIQIPIPNCVIAEPMRDNVSAIDIIEKPLKPSGLFNLPPFQTQPVTSILWLLNYFSKFLFQCQDFSFITA
jgi:hypothetical protein